MFFSVCSVCIVIRLRFVGGSLYLHLLCVLLFVYMYILIKFNKRFYISNEK